MPSATRPAHKLRELIDSKTYFVAADAYSALTGRIVEHVGFPAAYLGGHACSAFHYAIPDNGVFSPVEQIEQAGRIAAAINIPLIADADTLGETVTEAFHYARRFERAGVAGIHIEDEVNPKHSRFVNGLVPVADMQAKIAACVQARLDPAFVLIARCDELYPNSYRGGGGGSVEEAIRRGRAYAEAGADVLLYPLATPEVTAELQKSVPIPICVLGLPIPGTAFTLHTGWGWLGAAQLHLQRARQLFETGKVEMSMALPEKEVLIQQDIFDDLVRDWAQRTGRPAR